MGKSYWQKKTLSETLNNISSRNEVRASRYLILKNNKITVEKEQQDIANLENFVLRERLVDKNVQGNWDRVRLKSFCHHNTASSSCMQ